MAEREKIINGLDCCLEGLCDLCKYCNSDGPGGCSDELMLDALTLLKAQEPIVPVKVNRYIETDENSNWFLPETYDCGNCGAELHSKANYCHLCGKAVKWE